MMNIEDMRVRNNYLKIQNIKCLYIEMKTKEIDGFLSAWEFDDILFF